MQSGLLTEGQFDEIVDPKENDCSKRVIEKAKVLSIESWLFDVHFMFHLLAILQASKYIIC